MSEDDILGNCHHCSKGIAAACYDCIADSRQVARLAGFRAGMEKAAQVVEAAMAMNLDLRHFEVRCTSGSCPNCRVMGAIRAAAEKGERDAS